MACAVARGQAVSGRLILLRHGQTHANVARRLDTRPPGAELTDLGRRQARRFARSRSDAPALVLHSAAVRAAQTAAEIAAEFALTPTHVEGIHEVQAGDLEDRSDDDAINRFRAVYQRWHEGDLDQAMPGGETGREVLDRYLPVLEEVRVRYLDDGHGGSTSGDVVVVSHGSAIRLVAATLAGVDRRFALERHLDNTESVVLERAAGGRWRCVQWGSLRAPFLPGGDADPVDDVPGVADPMG